MTRNDRYATMAQMLDAVRLSFTTQRYGYTSHPHCEDCTHALSHGKPSCATLPTGATVL